MSPKLSNCLSLSECWSPCEREWGRRQFFLVPLSVRTPPPLFNPLSREGIRSACRWVKRLHRCLRMETINARVGQVVQVRICTTQNKYFWWRYPKKMQKTWSWSGIRPTSFIALVIFQRYKFEISSIFLISLVNQERYKWIKDFPYETWSKSDSDSRLSEVLRFETGLEQVCCMTRCKWKCVCVSSVWYEGCPRFPRELSLIEKECLKGNSNRGGAWKLFISAIMMISHFAFCELFKWA